MSKYLLDQDCWKVLYHIDSVKKRFIEDVMMQIGFKNDLTEIRTGKAGQLLLQKAESKYLNKVKWDEDFDPVHADQEINPLVNGWRLSSYIFYITVDNQIVKIIPRMAPDQQGAELGFQSTV